MIRNFYSDEISNEENNQDSKNIETKTDENNLKN